MIHNAYQYSKSEIIEMIRSGEGFFELDIVNGLKNVFVGHFRNPFRIGYKGKLVDWITGFGLISSVIRKKIQIGIEFKSYSYQMADRVAEIMKSIDMGEIELVVLKPAKNWFYGEKRKKIAEYFLEKYSGEIKIVKGF
ncbi:MAG TPA: hypothetical protein DHW82_14230 [Spirochaetia bacterium]|nr:MAG: hypothetical protein A2Y41_00370 [Spirochaetes bacterium GWB1_36_13]HCL58148.1 hypothetical protein [Spirochaetia bacterium]